MSLVYIGFAPHPPIIIPQIGRGEEEKCAATATGMAKIAQGIRDVGAEILVVVSPHLPIREDRLFYLDGDQEQNGDQRSLKGDLSAFRAPGVAFSCVTVPEIHRSLRELGMQSVSSQLDHGVMVPLYFLRRAGWQGRLVVISSPPTPPETAQGTSPGLWGERIAHILEEHPQRCALLASGDLSHKLKEDGPYGFHPAGPRFDHLIAQGLRTGPEMLASLPEILVDEAAQCGYASLLLALGARQGFCKVFSYEGPFGVGYLTAELYRSSPIAGYARACLAACFEGDQTASALPDETLFVDPSLKKRKSCFVTLHKDGDLRGCIGTIQPVCNTLADEIRHNAISAAMHDPRFPPVKEEELAHITLSVDVLGDMEEVADRAVLDPHAYGVVVHSRGRTGLLLPHLSGVDTVDEQLSIACRKAGIQPGEDFEIQRFQVDRYYE